MRLRPHQLMYMDPVASMTTATATTTAMYKITITSKATITSTEAAFVMSRIGTGDAQERVVHDVSEIPMQPGSQTSG